MTTDWTGTGTGTGTGGRRDDGATAHPAFAAYAAETPPQAAPGAPGKRGELRLAFAPDRDGRTRLARDFARVPYHVSGTLDHDPDPMAATVYLQSPTGGIAQGDRLHAEIRAAEGATAVVSPQSATKVQSMDRNYASETVALTAESGASLALVAEPTILHAGSRFARETTLKVSDGATAVLGDVVVPGRLAREESFAFDRYATRVRIEDDAGLLVEDATHLCPAESDPTAPGVLGEYLVHGSLYVVAPDADSAALADRIHETLDESSTDDGETTAGRAAATTLPNSAGVLVRALAHRAEDATNLLYTAWDVARRSLRDVPAPDPRRY